MIQPILKTNIVHSVILPVLFLFSGTPSMAQEGTGSLRSNISGITKSYRAAVGIAAIHIEKGDTFTFNNSTRYPMQSVYKFPLALAVLHEVDNKNISLQQQVRITSADMIDDAWSPLKKKYPSGNVDMSIAELLEYSVSLSDNIACDILFRVMKGTGPVNRYIRKTGVKGIEITATELEMDKDQARQYKNWSHPYAMSVLLKEFSRGKYLSDSSTRFLMHLMTETSNSPKRIKGLLDEKITVAHKTGTSSNGKDFHPACNDAGIITLPDGSHIALTVFVMNSYESYETTEAIIAKVSKEITDFYKQKR